MTQPSDGQQTEISLEELLREEKKQAVSKAWDALGRYKFQMFGYWAAIWVHLNRISGDGDPNPFTAAVKMGKEKSPHTKEEGLFPVVE